MGFFDKIKKAIFDNDEKKTEIEKQVLENQDKYAAALVENEVICNGCGQVIDSNPRFMNHQGRKMFFHKKCLKKLKQGKLP